MKEPVATKYHVDFAQLRNATELSPAKKYLSWLQTTLMGTSGGLGFGSSLMFVVSWTVIAIAGVAVATLFTTLATVLGGVLIGGFSLIYAREQTKRDERDLKDATDKLIEKQKALQNDLIELVELFEQLNLVIEKQYAVLIQKGAIKENDYSITDLLVGEKHIVPGGDKDLEHFQRMLDVRRNLVRTLCANLSLVSGVSYSDKLLHVFNESKDSLSANLGRRVQPGKQELVENGTSHLLAELDRMHSISRDDRPRGAVEDRSAIAEKVDKLGSNLFKQYQAEKSRKHHKVIRKLTGSYAIAGLGGFFAGIGAYVTIATLVVGGVAALLTGGAAIPILLAGIGVAVVCGGLAVAYRHHVQRKKNDASKMLSRSATTLETFGQDVKNTNNEANNLVKTISYQQQAMTFASQIEVAKKYGRLQQFVESQQKDIDELKQQFDSLQTHLDANLVLAQHKSMRLENNQENITKLIELRDKYQSLQQSCLQKSQELNIPIDNDRDFNNYFIITKKILILEEAIHRLKEQVPFKQLVEKGEGPKFSKETENVIDDQKSNEPSFNDTHLDNKH